MLRESARYLLQFVDWLYHRLHRSEPVGPLMMVSHGVHKGPDKHFNDGTVLVEGDAIGDFHIDNRIIAQLNPRSSRAAALRFGRLLYESFGELARKSVDEAGWSRYRAYRGVTWMPPHGQTTFGFETEPLEEGPRKRFLGVFFRVLVWVVAPAAETRASVSIEPTVFWMTRKQLLKNFIEKEDAAS